MNSQDSVPLYSGKPIAFSPRPVKMKRSTYDFIESSLAGILKQLEDFTTQILGSNLGPSFKRDKDLLTSLGVPTNLDGTPTPLGLHIPFARFDFSLGDDGKIQIMELNTDGTSSWNVVEWVAEQSKIPNDANPNFNLSLRLLAGLRAHKPEALKVFLMDFPTVLTKWEQDDLMRRWSRVLPAQRCEPNQRSWDQGGLIYRRTVSWNLRENSKAAEPFLKDWLEKKITVVGGWSSDIGMSKAWPAILKNPLTIETVLVDDQNRRLLKEQKDLWVLKRHFSHSGQGVTCGIDVSEAEWAMKIRENGKFIAQKFIVLPEFEGERLEWGMYFINGKASGLLARSGHKGAITDDSEDLVRPVLLY